MATRTQAFKAPEPPRAHMLLLELGLATPFLLDVGSGTRGGIALRRVLTFQELAASPVDGMAGRTTPPISAPGGPFRADHQGRYGFPHASWEPNKRRNLLPFQRLNQMPTIDPVRGTWDRSFGNSSVASDPL